MKTVLTSMITSFLLISCMGKITEIGLKENQTIFNQSFKIDWEDVKYSEGYLVEVSANEDFSQLAASETVKYSDATFGTGRSVDIKLPEGDYYIRIKPMINGKARGPWSDPFLFHYTPLELSLIEPFENFSFEQNKPFSIIYTSKTSGTGSTHLIITEVYGFRETVFDEELLQGENMAIEIPGLEQGKYTIKAVFHAEDTGEVIESASRTINIENPYLWLHPKSSYDNSIYTVRKVLSNGDLQYGGRLHTIQDWKQVEFPGNRALLAIDSREGQLFLQDGNGIFAPVEGLRKPGTTFRWHGIDKGEDSIYLTGSFLTGGTENAVIHKLNTNGIFIKEILLDPVRVYQDGSSIEAVDIFEKEQSLLVAGNGYNDSDPAVSNIWIAEIDHNGEILAKAHYMDTDSFTTTILEFIGDTEVGYLYLGKTRTSEEFSKWKPVLFHFIRSEQTLRRIDLQAPESAYSGDAIFLPEDNSLLVGWGSILCVYPNDFDTGILKPNVSYKLTSDPLTPPDTIPIPKTERINDLDIIGLTVIVSGTEVYDESTPERAWIAGIRQATGYEFNWLNFSSGEGEIDLTLYSNKLLEYGEDWAPWRENTATDDDKPEYDLLYMEEGLQKGTINVFQSPETVFGETMNMHPPVGEIQNWGEIREVEGVYLIGRHDYTTAMIITAPEWHLLGDLHTGVSRDYAQLLVSDYKPFTEEDGQYVPIEEYSEYMSYFSDYTAYIDEDKGMVIYLFYSENRLAAISICTLYNC